LSNKYEQVQLWTQTMRTLARGQKPELDAASAEELLYIISYSTYCNLLRVI